MKWLRWLAITGVGALASYMALAQFVLGPSYENAKIELALCGRPSEFEGGVTGERWLMSHYARAGEQYVYATVLLNEYPFREQSPVECGDWRLSWTEGAPVVELNTTDLDSSTTILLDMSNAEESYISVGYFVSVGLWRVRTQYVGDDGVRIELVSVSGADIPDPERYECTLRRLQTDNWFLRPFACVH